MFPCEAEHDSELSFQAGAIFNAGKCYLLHQSLTQNQPRYIGFGRGPRTVDPIFSRTQRCDEGGRLIAEREAREGGAVGGQISPCSESARGSAEL